MAGHGNGVTPEKAERYSERREEEEEEQQQQQEENERKSRKSRGNSASDSEEDRRKHGKSRRKERESPDSDGERRKGKSRRRHSSSEEDSSSGSESEYSDSEHSSSDSESESLGSEKSESESERRRRKRKEKRRRREKEEEGRERRRRKREKERKRRRREREEERRKKEKRKKKKRKEKKDRGKTGAVTNSWGKYGIIRETDMWNKRPEFTAWLAEVRQVNLESLPNWEEKQMFKEFMEDHNTATFPSKKYYNLDAYFTRKMKKEMKRGYKKFQESERTVFNDEEQRRQELLREREKQKEAEVEALKRSMQGGMAQAMKEQAQLREEMAYQYKVGNFEAAAAIQRRLDPDVAM